MVWDGREVKALAASHITSNVRGRQQWMQSCCCQPCFPHSHIVQNLLPIKHPRIADLSTSTSVIQTIFHRHAQWAISWMILDFVKVIIKSDHHGTLLLFWIFPKFLDWRYLDWVVQVYFGSSKCQSKGIHFPSKLLSGGHYLETKIMRPGFLIVTVYERRALYYVSSFLNG